MPPRVHILTLLKGTKQDQVLETETSQWTATTEKSLALERGKCNPYPGENRSSRLGCNKDDKLENKTVETAIVKIFSMLMELSEK